jgi:hypothetical protein
MECSGQVEIYKRRKPRETFLWKLLDHHFWEFGKRYDDLFQQQYGKKNFQVFSSGIYRGNNTIYPRALFSTY